jgi:HK97 family phage prohead protease
MQTSAITLKLDIKALSDREFEGYGSVFNNVDLVGDVVAPGAFKGSLAEHRGAGTMPLMFWMHKPDQVAGAWVSMREDARGLSVKGVLAQTPLGDEMRSLLGLKAVRGLSIGFRTRDTEWVDDEERGLYRVIKEVDLVEVSLVSLAANPLAEVTASKSRLSANGEYVQTPREFEGMLRKSGYSRTTSERIAFKVFGAGGKSSGDDDRRQGEPDLAETAAKAQRLLRSLGSETTPKKFWR